MEEIEPILIKNAKIYTEENMKDEAYILLENRKITSISQKEPDRLPEGTKIIDGTDLSVIPGFIDGHIHGAHGADTMDATEKALNTMADLLPAEGTTSFLATTITQSPENIENALVNAANFKNKPGQAEILGIHLEGPFIEKSKKGAQPLEYIMEPDIEQFKKWQLLAAGKIKTITMAPEHDTDGSFIRYLYETGVNVSAGHTGTNFEGMKVAVSHGVRQLTHICNAMNGIHHRDIGVVGAGFQLKELKGELIADGIHIQQEMLQIIYNAMGSERLILITDAMRAKGLTPGEYELGGQPVKVSEDRALLESGSLAGSILKMKDGVKQMLQLEGVSLENVIEMASINPAKQIGVFNRKGSIAPGKDADLLVVDDKLNISYTICGGVIGFKNE
ncbi:N-acetylglucosamine-6-phosphate deacetylase [Virgibacillus indicus]|uniref:N-acetylglucosamine-6-phosphate deacetylase n=1 Tax=Virgibacillus indicus TaxID=2024554 RepID=A0A265N9G7_9BACI|nr:N-acetylglucosamine-6-phosphate deacetylase [Virgibacillus indicus]OZU88099.1 N-acetylglucosamine-6-phosphate deacetylase [Virgibacillus indicus]